MAKTAKIIKTAYVTGSTGFLGVNIIHCLLDNGWKVIALKRRRSDTKELDKLDITQVEGDVLDIESLRSTIPERVDAIFHVAGDTSMWSGYYEKQDRINIDGTRNIVEVALEKNVGRFIHTSSLGAFGDITGRVIDEETPSEAMGSKLNYYKSKYLAEQEVLAGISRGLDAVILNPSQIIGPYDYHYIPQIFQNLKATGIMGYPVGSMVFGHAKDYAKAHLSAYEKGRTGERYLLGGVHASFKAMFETVGKLINVKPPKFPTPPALLTCLAYIMEGYSHLVDKEPILTPDKAALLNGSVHVNSRKAEIELGFSTCSLEEMFRDSYVWMREAGIIS